jgi:hypothetical protein
MRFIMVLLLILLLFTVSCKKTVEENTELLETLDISECSDDKEACCNQQCVEFCTNNNKIYTKHFVNGDHCPCWCD